MSIAEKVRIIDQNLEPIANRAYFHGYNEGYYQHALSSIEWDVIQNYGNRTYYPNVFAYWGWKECDPKYKIAPDNMSFAEGFIANTKLENVRWDKFDLSKVTSLSQTFKSCSSLQNIDAGLTVVSSSATAWKGTFYGCKSLKRIKGITASAPHTWTDTFNGCDALADITFGGTIGNDISFADSPNLTAESIESIFAALSDDVTGKTLTLANTVQSTCKKILSGLGKYPFADEDTKTTCGISFTKIDESSIRVNGTNDGTGTSEYSILQNYKVTGFKGTRPFRLFDTDGVFTDCLNMLIMDANGDTRHVKGSESAVIEITSGEVIMDISLVIPADDTRTFDNWVCVPVLVQDDWLYMTTLKSNWTIVC